MNTSAQTVTTQINGLASATTYSIQVFATNARGNGAHRHRFRPKLNRKFRMPPPASARHSATALQWSNWSAAADNGSPIEHVDLAHAFDGHELCSADPGFSQFTNPKQLMTSSSSKGS
jgi:hypothetical protein